MAMAVGSIHTVSRACTLWPLCKGRRVLEVGGARSAIRSYCKNKNWKLVFLVLGKMILPLGIRIHIRSITMGSFTPLLVPWAWEQNCDLS